MVKMARPTLLKEPGDSFRSPTSEPQNLTPVRKSGDPQPGGRPSVDGKPLSEPVVP